MRWRNGRCHAAVLGPHSFRRANITWRQEVGGSSIEASKIAGHGTVRMTEESTKIQLTRQDELTRRIQERLASPRDGALKLKKRNREGSYHPQSLFEPREKELPEPFVVTRGFRARNRVATQPAAPNRGGSSGWPTISQNTHIPVTQLYRRYPETTADWLSFRVAQPPRARHPERNA